MDAFPMSISLWEGIVIGGVGGTIAGLTVWVVELLKEKVTEYNDKKRVYDWLCQRTQKYKSSTVGSPNDPRWVPTIEIASYTNLTPDRVRYICSIHKDIRPKMKEDLWPREPWEEKWGIRKFIDSLRGESLN